MRNRDEQEREIAEGIGANVRAARLAAGLGQEKLARRADVALNTIVRVEAGASWSPATLAAIAKALGIPLRKLFGPTGRYLSRSAA